MNIKKKQNSNFVCIIGLGFVGLTLSIAMTNGGFKVFGVEKNKYILKKLREKKGHFYEPGLDKFLKQNLKRKKFSFSKKIPKNKNISTYIVTVGTPLNPKKKIKTADIIKACKEIAKVLKDEDTVILRSTVKVGTTKNIVYPILNKTKKNFHLVYCPERAIEGSALKELNNLPQVIGGINKKSINKAKQIFKKITKKIIVTSNIETAEMIKLIDNSSRDLFFAYANEVAKACDAVGISVSEVINSGKSGYVRTHVAKPGLVGGACLHKDPHIYSQSLKKYGVSAKITLMGREINESQPIEIAKFIYNLIKKIKNFPKKPKISLLGLAFKGKPNTDDLRDSMSIKVFEVLKKKYKQSKFFGYDPVVPQQNIKKLGLNATSSVSKAFSRKDLVVILNNHHVFSDMPIQILSKTLKKPAIIYDFWNHFDSNKIKLPKDVEYISLGNHYKSKYFRK
jgi:nucleotide sugar dehydrogenase